MSKSNGLHEDSLVFLSGKRTPFGANGGKLKDVLPGDLGTIASQAAMAQAGVAPDQIDHVIFGSVLQSSPDGIYAPRHIGLKSGIPENVPALGINRLCGSGFQSIVEAWHQMLAGDTQVALVGGVENMSMAPYLFRKARFGARMGHQPLTDMLIESLHDLYAGAPMGVTAETLGSKYGITRAQADEFALWSQVKTREANAAGKFADELTPVTDAHCKGGLGVDEHPKPETTIESLAKLKSVFIKDGLVTAGSASGIVDGAAAMVVARESVAKSRGLKPMGRMVSYGISGCDPKIMGIGPVPASKLALERAGLKISDMDLIEVNEAFAPQALAVQKELGIPNDRFNVNGGAIAIGHPLGASGTRIAMSTLYELRRRGARRALVSACIGGGQGIALVIEAV